MKFMEKRENENGSAAEKLVLRLYVAGDAPNSVRAVANLKAICRRWLETDQYELEIIDVLPLHGLILILTGGAIYLVGGIVYARRAPNPWPGWFGFHEVFHVLVVVGGAAHVTAIWRYAIPLAA